MVDQRVLVTVAQSKVPVFPFGCQVELIQRPEPYVYVPVLDQFIVKIFLREISIQCQECIIFLSGIGK